jgi:hypothetical protein
VFRLFEVGEQSLLRFAAIFLSGYCGSVDVILAVDLSHPIGLEADAQLQQRFVAIDARLLGFFFLLSPFCGSQIGAGFTTNDRRITRQTIDFVNPQPEVG